MSGGEFLGLEIKNARKQKSITLLELAHQIGVNPLYLARLELCEIAPIPEQIELIKSTIEDWPEEGVFPWGRSPWGLLPG